MVEENEIAAHREAKFRYRIFDSYEAGIVLRGPEVKSIRNGKVILRDSFVRIIDGEAYVFNLHISPYPYSMESLDPARSRKLLLNEHEIKKLAGQITRKGFTCVPLSVYFKKGKAKLKIALCQGKKLYDKREAIRRREQEREMARALKRKNS